MKFRRISRLFAVSKRKLCSKEISIQRNKRSALRCMALRKAPRIPFLVHYQATNCAIFVIADADIYLLGRLAAVSSEQS